MCVWFGLLEVPGEGAGVCAWVAVILFSVVCCSVLFCGGWIILSDVQ